MENEGITLSLLLLKMPSYLFMIVVENAKLFSYEKAEKVANAGTKGSHIRNIIKFSGSTVKIASQVKIATD